MQLFQFECVFFQSVCFFYVKCVFSVFDCKNGEQEVVRDEIYISCCWTSGWRNTRWIWNMSWVDLYINENKVLINVTLSVPLTFRLSMWLQFKGGFYFYFWCGFYSRATYIQGRGYFVGAIGGSINKSRINLSMHEWFDLEFFIIKLKSSCF